MKRLLTLLAAIIVLASCQRELTDYVNPFVGTDLHGHTFPGAIVPFGMIQPSPDTRLEGWDGCSVYHYSDDTIYGFSHTHLSGTGCEDYGDILVMPFSGEQDIDQDWMAQKKYKSHFSHKSERAEPGYYSVILDNSRVLAELTVAERFAVHRYTFPSKGPKGIVVDLTSRDKTLDCELHYDPYEDAIVGYRHSSSWSPNQYCYFAMAANVEFDSISYIKAPKGIVVDESETAYAVLYFPEEVKDVELRIAISAVDEDGALKNLAESLNPSHPRKDNGGIHPFSFNEVRAQAHQTWEKELSKIKVEGGTKEDRRNFYTSLYHCFTAPYLYSDIDGRYRGQNDSIYTCDEGRRIYTIFSLWDTYRALHPLLTLIDRERTADFMYTFEKCWETGRELPMWELSSHETHCMIGYHAVPVILDAQKAGILDQFDDAFRKNLLNAMVATSNRTEAHRSYARMGYLSSEIDNESVSKTLEYAFDDWCIAQYAKAIGAGDSIYRIYIRRAQSWKNIMDENGFMHARRNGGFVSPFSPTEVNNHFTEANSWQYSTYVPHDLKNYFNMLGGNDRAEQFLDSLFHTTAKLEGRDQSDIDGLIGQYAHGNEPSHHAAYLYNYLGRQWKTAELVRQICTELYTSKPDGEIGNDDCGQMAAWYVFSALGFYPVCPGSDHYAIGSPLFKKATIRLENGKTIEILANNTSHRNKYVAGLLIDGLDGQGLVGNAFVLGRDLREGCVLDFNMSSSPNTSFGAEHFNTYLTGIEDRYIIATPYFSRWEQRFNDSTSLKIFTNATEDCTIYYTLDGTTPDTNAFRYTTAIPINSDITIKAVAYSPEKGYSNVVEQHLTRFVADKKLTYITEPDKQYRDSGEEGLIDRLYGTTNYRIGGWQGWQSDMEVVVDLLHTKQINLVSVDCLSDCRSWVFFPAGIEVEYSEDGHNYAIFNKVNDLAKTAMSDPTWNYKEDSRQKSFEVSGNATARYLKIKVTNYGKLPSWHISAGQQAWLFIDEIKISESGETPLT